MHLPLNPPTKIEAEDEPEIWQIVKRTLLTSQLEAEVDEIALNDSNKKLVVRMSE